MQWRPSHLASATESDQDVAAHPPRSVGTKECEVWTLSLGWPQGSELSEAPGKVADCEAAVQLDVAGPACRCHLREGGSQVERLTQTGFDAQEETGGSRRSAT